MIARRTLLVAAAVPLAAPALAQISTSRPLRLIVPNPPGGQSDTIARLYGEAIQATSGQAVVVENRSGANGLIAMDVVAKAAPDGLTTELFSITMFTSLPAMMARMPLDVDRDVTPITSVVTSTTLCCVRADRAQQRGWTDLGAMLEWAKRPGNELTNGAASSGGASHLLTATIARRSGAAITVVPYRGGAPALNDLLAGNIDMAFDFMPALLPHVAAGTLKAMAVGSKERVPFLPDVPGMGDFPAQGIADIDLQSWNILSGPGSLPPELAARTQDLLRRAAAHPGLEDRLRANGLLALPPLDAAGTRARILADRPRWQEMVQISGARIE
ncbi:MULTISPECIES: Bug family tripartite tricarboxylate transporter substrate binding protein [Roseomonadaceae]|uniref:Tripartite tricarboxylate transporter substrate binding protein n=1 Tax=Falsiroseomonas oleicola TaxID=2801474 RepID=A0ABS6HAL5_9PROT|nr:tripartite tricarboxylate transporter substrate binding protein [Roseomonas oleicola]MBU8545734.1 tripartite tricarboxylate transporter substrate binding protein [Roseomonas oleicola]